MERECHRWWNSGAGLVFSLKQKANGASVLFVLTILTALMPQQTMASTGELYGYGSRTSAMGNTMFGAVDNGFATFYNPAANSANPGIHLSLALMYYNPQFKAIDGIVTKNSVTYPTTTEVIDNIDNKDYNDHLGQALGVSMNFGENLKNLTLGATAFMPLDRIAYLDTGETFKPEYFNYRSRTQRPQIYGSMSIKPFNHLYLGTGLAVATNMVANATILATSSAGSVSQGRFTASLRPSIAPYFSAYTDLKPVRSALTIRLPNRYKTSLDTGADAKVFGTAGSFSVVLNAASTIYYDPLEIDWGLACDIDERTMVTAEVDWLQYKAFEPPSLTLTNQPGGTINMNNSINTTPAMRNIFVPKIGIEHVFGKLTGRAGALYRPSAVVDNLGSGNLVDPDKFVVTIGAGLDLQKMNLTSKKIRIDFHTQYHQLLTKHVEKSPGDELGGTSQRKIGAPGYDIGGSIWGGGLTASMEL